MHAYPGAANDLRCARGEPGAAPGAHELEVVMADKYGDPQARV